MTVQVKHMDLAPQTAKEHLKYTVSTQGSQILSASAHDIQALPGDIKIDRIPLEFDTDTGIPMVRSSSMKVFIQPLIAT